MWPCDKYFWIFQFNCTDIFRSPSKYTVLGLITSLLDLTV